MAADASDKPLIAMPKLYEYFGLIVLFYSGEHEPIHVHGLCQGRECRAELVVADGRVMTIRFGAVTGRSPLRPSEMADFRAIIRQRADDIVAKWVDFFVWQKPVKSERITRRLR